MEYRRDIDGLRALAVLPVIAFHAGVTNISGGFAGVDVFFVISGYLITGIILGEISKGTFSFFDFYLRRARRILPLLFFIVSLSVFLGVLLSPPERVLELSITSLYALLFSSNFYFYSNQDYFSPEAELNPLLHTWSLAVEEQYYLFFPILMVLLWRNNIRFGVVAALTTFSFFLADSLSTRFVNEAYYLLPFRMWEIGVGALLAFRREDVMPLQRYASYIQIAGLLLILSCYFLIDSTLPWPSLYTLLPVLGAAMIIGWKSSGLINKLLSCRLLVKIGLISYSLYLVHQPVIVFLKELIESENIIFCVFVFFVSFVFAILCHYLIERPFRQSNYNIGKVIGVSSLTLTPFILSFVLIQSQGYLNEKKDAVKDFFEAHENEKNSEFVRGKYNSQSFDSFPTSKKPNLLIVGDSFSQDLYNSLDSTGVLDYYNVVTYYVHVKCQIYLSQADHKDSDFEYVLKADKAFCKNGKSIRRNLQIFEEADIVVFAGMWRDWAAENIDNTINLLPLKEQQKIFVVGTKWFPKPKLEYYSRLDNRLERTFQPPESVKNINSILKKKSSELLFIDQMSVLCSDGVCPEFATEESLISYDGGHLTPSGAQKIGKLLINSTGLSCLKFLCAFN
ncbi:acyltransferase family protein [Microbulbifer sp. EKSA008]|uniref:acyltransferase family protein n=1 Tax=Microbulbifer sp. EKSA008 TaxID=3243367 RepID=UPI0040427ABA